jgi:hypothetical protein
LWNKNVPALPGSAVLSILFSNPCAKGTYSSGSFSISRQIPQGHPPAQKPQPMQRSAATVYS